MVEIKKTDLKKLVEQKGQIERRIKSRKLANYKVEQVGGYIADDEIFVPQFKCPDYYVSNYGRVISCKFGKVKLLNMYDKRKTDGMRYKYYCLCKKGKKRAKNILIHRSVAQLFCPNLFKDVRDKNGNPIPLDIHHLNHNEQDNRSENLIWLPKYLHRHCNDIGKFGIFRTKNARNLHPLEIVAQTGLDLKDIILAKRQEPIKKVGKWTVYDVQGHLIALELLNESDKKDDKKQDPIEKEEFEDRTEEPDTSYDPGVIEDDEKQNNQEEPDTSYDPGIIEESSNSNQKYKYIAYKNMLMIIYQNASLNKASSYTLTYSNTKKNI